MTSHNLKHHQLGLTDDAVLRMYAYMIKARKFDERATLLQRSGKSAFHISSVGQEAAQVAAAFALDHQQDYFLPYYRDYAFVLTVGMSVKELLLAALFKAEDVNGGRQMPGHFGYRKLRIVSGSSPVATQVLHAVGIALTALMRKEEHIAFVSFGEGSSNQGDVHEAFNFAGVFKLPVVFLCENNQYAISIPAHRQVAGRVVDRAAGYGFPGLRVDGNDALEVYRVVKEARERAVRGYGPTLIEAMMYRIPPHSTADDDLLYRTKEEVEYHREQEGVVRFRRYLMECDVLNEEMDRALHENIAKEVNEATKYAEKAPYPAPEDALRHVFAEEGGEA
ncbi:thiamine pyrophosphate-dependent dehydrogenase E1 component subunit alpha [Paenibacillus sp. GCM10023248]|uniref:thiamine pyrophosphate-dependent dehydrogenase E1 component subunit alpha n=1 Tax=unclassified Paenibacillus TaxID=185978 RepID=UPI0023782C43|nr:thiamine pyrophosphate-dependent dehydrogenase E1 component subunit alpha [Paenibacillus sp. MAHUQ-63]MDD9270420.1 thiamine pyrophosphate-dependent dehydrogenase E1 component subunit alpha [Paenibacillus sp. MAHUQ-63]